MFDRLVHALTALTSAVWKLAEREVTTTNPDTTAILKRLAQLETTIMSAISTFAAAQQAFNVRHDKAVDGLTSDIKALNDKITELQESGGGITAEDQALLDDLQARGETVAAKLEALDALTPPTPPVA